MKKISIAGTLIFLACMGGPLFPVPYNEPPEVIWADDFESGHLTGTWETHYCEESIENDGDNYLQLTAWPTVQGEFWFRKSIIYRFQEVDPPKAVDISLAFKMVNLERPAYGRFNVGGYVGCTLEPTTAWRRAKFRVEPQEWPVWPASFTIKARKIENYVPGMALAVDDVMVVPIY